MGRAEIRRGEETPPCPKCKDVHAIPLARDEARARFQCSRDECGEHFSVPANQVPVRPDAVAPASTTPRASTPATTPVDYCAKGCGQPFRTEDAKRLHEPTCDGPAEPERDGGEEPKEEIVANCWCGKAARHPGRHRGAGANKPPASPRASDAAKRFSESREKREGKGAPEERPAAAVGGALGEAIAGLEAKRQAIVDALLAGNPELRQIDDAIAALRKLASSGTEGGGSDAPPRPTSSAPGGSLTPTGT